MVIIFRLESCQSLESIPESADAQKLYLMKKNVFNEYWLS